MNRPEDIAQAVADEMRGQYTDLDSARYDAAFAAIEADRAGEAKTPVLEPMDADTMAKILCRIESRRTGRSFDEVVAPNIELWMRHRYEAEQLLEELADWGYPVTRTVDPEPWVDQDGWRWSTAKKDGYLSHGPSTFTWSFEPRTEPAEWTTTTEYAYGSLDAPDIITPTGEDIDDRGTAQYHAQEFWISALRRTVKRGPWSVIPLERIKE